MSYRRGNTVAQLNERLKPAINVQGMLYTTRAALPHLLQAAEVGSRRVGDLVNISSIAGRVA